MKTQAGVLSAFLLIAATLATLGGCKSGGQRLRELSAAHAEQWDVAVARHNELNSACKGEAACLEAERSRFMAELTVLMDEYNARVLALVEGY